MSWHQDLEKMAYFQQRNHGRSGMSCNIISQLHKAMTSCKDKWFKKPGVLMIGWAKEFLTVEGAQGNR
jgi:hypothetical protein